MMRLLLDSLVRVLGRLPENRIAWSYTIRGSDGSPYLTRALLPRISRWRPVVHQIHREDEDPDPHNHPWDEAYFLIVTGGYTEERLVGLRRENGALVGGRVVTQAYRPGDVNHLRSGDFHRIAEYLPGTRTLGLLGRRVQEWGFLVDGRVVPWREYLQRKQYLRRGDGKS